MKYSIMGNMRKQETGGMFDSLDNSWWHNTDWSSQILFKLPFDKAYKQAKLNDMLSRNTYAFV